MTDKNLLAIQSHVVHGYVGNRAATFPLQLRGWNVDALNTVQFSNNTGYGAFRGTRATEEEVSALYEGLKIQDFEYSALLTGYLPSAEVVNAVARIGVDLRHRFPNLTWLLDPVMGDEGRLYVKEDVIPAYKTLLESGVVSIITPNEFEVEILTGIKLDGREAIIKAIEFLHTKYKVPHVVISSISQPHNRLMVVGSSSLELSNSQPFSFVVDKIDSYFTGTGDLFAALLLDSFVSFNGSDGALSRAVGSTLATLKMVLDKTYAYSSVHHPGGAKISDASMKYHELRLIESRDDIIQPAPAHLVPKCSSL